MNAELLRQMSYIAEDETLVAKVLNYVKHLVKTSVDENSNKQKVMADMGDMCQQIIGVKAGTLKGRPVEELFDEL